MAKVLKLPPLHLPRRQGQAGMFALQSLNSGQFVGAHHSFRSLGQGRGISVQLTNITDFGIKVRVIWGSQPIADQVGPQVPLFSSLAAWRGEICSTMPCPMISSATSRLVHWLMGRPR